MTKTKAFIERKSDDPRKGRKTPNARDKRIPITQGKIEARGGGKNFHFAHDTEGEGTAGTQTTPREGDPLNRGKKK